MSSSHHTLLPVMQIRPSRMLRLYLIGLSLSTIVVLWSMTSLYWSYSLIITMLIVTGAWQARKQNEKIVSLKQKAENLWLLELNHQSFKKARLLPNYYVTPWLLIMNFQTLQGQKYPLVLLRDRMRHSELRQLRVFLRQLML